MSAINTSPNLTALPRNMNEVRQRLLACIPSSQGEYRVFEGPELETPKCFSPGTSDVINSIFIIETKKPFKVAEISGKLGNGLLQFRFPDAYLMAASFSSNLTSEAARMQGLGNLGLSPRVFWRKLPGTSTSKLPPTMDPRLLEFTTAVTCITADESLNDYIFGRNYDPFNGKCGDHESDGEDSDFDRLYNHGIKLTHDGDLLQPQAAEHDCLPDNEEQESSAEFGGSEEDTPRRALFEEEQSIEDDDSESETLVADPAPKSLPTPVSNNKRSYADSQRNTDSHYPASRYSWGGRKSARENKKKTADNFPWSYPHFNVKYPRGGKTARISPSPQREPSLSESEPEDPNDSDFEDPSTFKKRKCSKKGKIPAKSTPSVSDVSGASDFENSTPSKKQKTSKKGKVSAKSVSNAKPKSEAKAPTEGKQPLEHDSENDEYDENAEADQDDGSIQSAGHYKYDQVIDSIEDHEPVEDIDNDQADEDFENAQDNDSNDDDEDESDQYIPSPRNIAGKSISNSKAFLQHESDHSEFDCEYEDEVQFSPERAAFGGKTFGGKSLPQYESDNADLDCEYEDESQFSPERATFGGKSFGGKSFPQSASNNDTSNYEYQDEYRTSFKRARSYGGKSLPQSASGSVSLDSDEEDDIQPPRKRARKSISQSEEAPQQQSYNYDSNDFGYSHALLTPEVSPFNAEAESSEVESPPPAKKVQRKSKPKSKATSTKFAQPGGWSQAEHDAAETILRARRSFEASNPDIVQFRDERLFKHVSDEMAQMGFTRAFGSIKNYWNRHGRVKSGFEERIGKAAGAPLVTSAQKPKGQGKPRVKKGNATKQELTPDDD